MSDAANDVPHDRGEQSMDAAPPMPPMPPLPFDRTDDAPPMHAAPTHVSAEGDVPFAQRRPSPYAEPEQPPAYVPFGGGDVVPYAPPPVAQQPPYAQPPYAQPGGYPGPYGPPSGRRANGLAVAGFVVGLVSVFLPLFFGLIGGIVGLVLSIVGVVKHDAAIQSSRGLGIAGIILSSVAVLFLL